MRTVDRVVRAPADFGLELIGVPSGADLDLRLRMESVSEGIYLSGTATTVTQGECGRCLRPISETVDIGVREFFAFEEHVTEPEDDDEEEVGRLQGDLIDLEPVLRDAVVLALPNHPLCREDCPGLCPECGVPFDELPGDHSHEQADPRWAALSNLKTSEE
jgi:uncharacterized protein